MRKRDVLRYVPVLSRVHKVIDDLEAQNRQLAAHSRDLAVDLHRLDDENRQLKHSLRRLVFSDVTDLTETAESTQHEAGGIPLPPGVLRYMVAGTEDVGWFLRTGQLGAQTVLDVLQKQGLAFDQLRAVLDFGCGCARVLRHFARRSHIALHGTDCNHLAIRWCQKHLDFAAFHLNALEPPLDYDDHAFDLIYAFSILTHLTEPLQTAWMAEFRRILAPGGHVIISVHGDATFREQFDRLEPAERESYQHGGLVVREDGLAGSNFCGAFHPQEYVRLTLARGFEVVDVIPEGAKGNPPQDLYLLRRPLDM